MGFDQGQGEEVTDRETLTAMFKRQEIDYTESPEDSESALPYIVVEGGYIGFQTWFSFNADGSLADVRAFE